MEMFLPKKLDYLGKDGVYYEENYGKQSVDG